MRSRGRLNGGLFSFIADWVFYLLPDVMESADRSRDIGG